MSAVAPPSPQRHEGPAEVAATMQRLHCANRSACLDVAAHGRWPAFTCLGCDAYTPPAAEDYWLESQLLSALGSVLARLPANDLDEQRRAPQEAQGDESP